MHMPCTCTRTCGAHGKQGWRRGGVEQAGPQDACACASNARILTRPHAQQAGSQRLGSKECMLEKSPSELMASVGEGEEAGADETAPHAAGTMPPPWPARRARPASSSPASSPPPTPPTDHATEASREEVLGGVLRAQGNPAAAQRWGVNVEPPPSTGYAPPRLSPPGASTAGQGVQA